MKRLIAAAVATIVAFSVACSGGSGGSSKPAATATFVPPTPMAYNVPADMKAEQLGSIALTLADYGPEFAAFAATVDTELTSVLERGLDACDPAKEQATLSKFGWAKAYERIFAPTGGGLPGLAVVGSVVDIYSTPDNASTKIKYDSKQVHEDQRAVNGCRGVGIERIQELGLPTVGDQSWAARMDFSVEHVRGTRYTIVFRRDRIVATVVIDRLNATDSSLQLLALAKLIDERLLKVITAPLTSSEPLPDQNGNS